MKLHNIPIIPIGYKYNFSDLNPTITYVLVKLINDPSEKEYTKFLTTYNLVNIEDINVDNSGAIFETTIETIFFRNIDTKDEITATYLSYGRSWGLRFMV